MRGHLPRLMQQARAELYEWFQEQDPAEDIDKTLADERIRAFAEAETPEITEMLLDIATEDISIMQAEPESAGNLSFGEITPFKVLQCAVMEEIAQDLDNYYQELLDEREQERRERAEVH